jgi:hypothetical protein
MGELIIYPSFFGQINEALDVVRQARPPGRD